MDGGSSPFANFLGALQEAECRLNDLEFVLSPIPFPLSPLESPRHTGALHPVPTPRGVDTLLKPVFLLRKFGHGLSIGGNQPDAAIETERRNGGSLIVFPAEAM